ncbi:MAG: hypothetical protein KJO54_00130, partial [Gammaproteobacteria bacterium]|nr:hypothetical protein [Gammaproteobacteria bacterium]
MNNYSRNIPQCTFAQSRLEAAPTRNRRTGPAGATPFTLPFYHQSRRKSEHHDVLDGSRLKPLLQEVAPGNGAAGEKTVFVCKRLRAREPERQTNAGFYACRQTPSQVVAAGSRSHQESSNRSGKQMPASMPAAKHHRKSSRLEAAPTGRGQSRLEAAPTGRRQSR